MGSMFQYWKRFDLQQLQVRLPRSPHRPGRAAGPPPPLPLLPFSAFPRARPPPPPPAAGPRRLKGTPRSARPRRSAPSALPPPAIDHRPHRKLILFVQFIDQPKMAPEPALPGPSPLRPLRPGLLSSPLPVPPRRRPGPCGAAGAAAGLTVRPLLSPRLPASLPPYPPFPSAAACPFPPPLPRRLFSPGAGESLPSAGTLCGGAGSRPGSACRRGAAGAGGAVVPARRALPRRCPTAAAAASPRGAGPKQGGSGPPRSRWHRAGWGGGGGRSAAAGG